MHKKDTIICFATGCYTPKASTPVPSGLRQLSLFVMGNFLRFSTSIFYSIYGHRLVLFCFPCLGGDNSCELIFTNFIRQCVTCTVFPLNQSVWFFFSVLPNSETELKTAREANVFLQRFNPLDYVSLECKAELCACVFESM